MRWSTRRLRRSSPSAPEGLDIGSAPAEGLARWENQGGSMGQTLTQTMALW